VTYKDQKDLVSKHLQKKHKLKDEEIVKRNLSKRAREFSEENDTKSTKKQRIITVQGTSVSNLDGPQNLEDFIETCLGEMRPSVLINSFGRSKGTSISNLDGNLKEASWAMEFYRIGFYILPENCILSAEVGGVFDSKGSIDFYINSSRKWLVELVRDSDLVQNHWERHVNIVKHKNKLKTRLIL